MFIPTDVGKSLVEQPSEYQLARAVTCGYCWLSHRQEASRGMLKEKRNVFCALFPRWIDAKDLGNAPSLVSGYK